MYIVIICTCTLALWSVNCHIPSKQYARKQFGVTSSVQQEMFPEQQDPTGTQEDWVEHQLQKGEEPQSLNKDNN